MSGVVFTAPAGTPAICSAQAAPFLSRPAVQPEIDVIDFSADLVAVRCEIGIGV